MQTLKNVFNRFQLNWSHRTTSWMVRSDWEQKHQFEIGDLDPYKNNLINLMVGAPGPHLLQSCSEIFQTATDHRMKIEVENNAFIFQYGAAVGNYEFRVNLAKFLSKYYANFVHPSDLVVTNGANTGLHMILTTLIDMSGIVFVDDLTYMIALNAIGQYTDMTIVPVPQNEFGTDIKKFEQLIAKHKFQTKSKKLFWGMYYTTTIFHNPTGKVFSPSTCTELSRLARQHDFLIACDDVYNLLNYSGDLHKRVYAYDDINDPDFKGNIISNGTFSQFLAPGIRIGWMECPPRCIEPIQATGQLIGGGCMNNYTTGILMSIMELELMDKQLQLHLDIYKQNMEAACEILKENLPIGCTFNAPGGGYFIWIELPKDTDGHEFIKFSIENYKVVAIVGDVFSFEKKFKNYLRISITFYELETLKKGVKLLCTALNEFLNKG